MAARLKDVRLLVRMALVKFFSLFEFLIAEHSDAVIWLTVVRKKRNSEGL